MSATTIAPGQQAAFTPEEEFQRAVRSRRLITWLLVFAIVMFFAGLTSAYVVSKSSADFWVRIALPKAFYYSTAFILAGSLTLQLALMAARSGKPGRIGPLVALTLVLGLCFAWSQKQGWAQLNDGGHVLSFSNVLQPTGVYGTDYTVEAQGVTLVKEGNEYFHPDDVARTKPLNADMAEHVNGASQYLIALTWAHFIHVAFGLIGLLVMLVMAMRHRYSQRNHVGLWAGTVYWHFLGGLWVYLLLFLLIVH
jgi:cytochrome c oxidase subunit 3